LSKATSPESNLNNQIKSLMGFNTAKSYTDTTIPEGDRLTSR